MGLDGFPRLMTKDALKTASARAAEASRARFGTIGGISGDIGVSAFPYFQGSLS